MSEQSGRDAGGPGQTGGGADNPPGRPGDGTKLPSEHAQTWHRAVISVYYFGRQNHGILGRHAPPIGVRSLAHALSVLAHAPVGPVRLALTDLCRTRAARPTSQTLKSAMEMLAARYQVHVLRLNPGLRNDGQLNLPRTFDEIFATHGRGSIDPDYAYMRAIGIMLEHEPRPPGQAPVLHTYSVTPS